MKNIIIAILVVFLVGVAGYIFYQKSNPQESLDENQERPLIELEDKKVFREKSSEDRIAELIALKHEKEVDEIIITSYQEEGDYARGGVEFAPGGPGNAGMFLAVKLENEWEIVYDGNGNPNCDKLETTYSFPNEMLKGFCY